MASVDPAAESTAMTSQLGLVYLVGAGCGDPGLITVRGVECLNVADVVLYDYLVNPRILDSTRPQTECVCLGKHGSTRIWPQEEVNRRIVKEARQGKTVVRLKGGDPMIFARAADEIEALIENQIPFEIVPGVTAALGAASYAGTPMTHRDLASCVALITGHEDLAKASPTLDFDALAKFPGTLVFYMGVTTVSKWTRSLMEAGKPPDTPAAIIRRCSFADQRTIRCTLGEVELRVNEHHKLRPPAIVVVGDVAGLPRDWNWFERRPLFGYHIVVARPRDQATELASRFQLLGAQAWIQPAIEITDPPDWSPVDAVIADLSQFDWIVFSSANGVRYFFERIFSLGRDLRVLGRAAIAVMGPGTAAAVQSYHIIPDCQPSGFRAEAMVEAFAGEATGKRFLLVRASRGRSVLSDGIRAGGGEVEEIVAYTSKDVSRPDPDIVKKVDQGEIDWVVVTSSAIAHSLAKMFGDTLNNTSLASISPVTTQALAEHGLTPAVEAERHDMEGIVEAILKTQ